MNLNFNILETNLINLVIVIAVLVKFLSGFLGGILERRRTAILQDLQDAETRLKTATEALAKAQGTQVGPFGVYGLQGPLKGI